MSWRGCLDWDLRMMVFRDISSKDGQRYFLGGF